MHVYGSSHPSFVDFVFYSSTSSSGLFASWPKRRRASQSLVDHLSISQWKFYLFIYLFVVRIKVVTQQWNETFFFCNISEKNVSFSNLFNFIIPSIKYQYIHSLQLYSFQLFYRYIYLYFHSLISIMHLPHLNGSVWAKYQIWHSIIVIRIERFTNIDWIVKC